MDLQEFKKKFEAGEEVSVEEQLVLINKLDEELSELEKTDPETYQVVMNMFSAYTDFEEADED